MALSVYNTLSRRKEPFVPLRPGSAGVYVCGPTVYGHSHVGHAKSYVSFDVIVRYLRFTGLDVLYVQNITDVGHLTDDADEGEDKIERQSKREKVHPMQLAESFTRSYLEDMDAMNVLRADIYPRATGHIVEQIELVRGLIEGGFAYEANGSVYFDVSKDADYGKLSNRSAAEAAAGTRVAVKSEKRHPNDFALWKRAEPGHIMRWRSPWGEGFPGWHAECSAMSMKYLGRTFDIHGGGMDNLFPHHECEIAQSESLTGKPFARYWLHNNLVTVGGQKMGKSLGNVIALKEAFASRDPLVVRFFILQSHYRGTLDFTTDALDAAAKGHEKILNTLRRLREAAGSPGGADPRGPEESGQGPSDPGSPGPGASGQVSQGPPPSGPAAEHRRRFLEAMDDDFNTPQAIAVLFDAAREANGLLASGGRDAGALRAYAGFFEEAAGRVLGLAPGGAGVSAGQSIEGGLLDLVVALRDRARREKQWGLSDAIRDGLAALGVSIEDGKEGTTWRRS